MTAIFILTFYDYGNTSIVNVYETEEAAEYAMYEAQEYSRGGNYRVVKYIICG